MLYSILITELSMVIVLYTSQTRTISILAFNTWNSGQFSTVAALAILQLVVGLGVMAIVQAATRQRATGVSEA